MSVPSTAFAPRASVRTTPCKLLILVQLDSLAGPDLDRRSRSVKRERWLWACLQPAVVSAILEAHHRHAANISLICRGHLRVLRAPRRPIEESNVGDGKDG